MLGLRSASTVSHTVNCAGTEPLRAPSLCQPHLELVSRASAAVDCGHRLFQLFAIRHHHICEYRRPAGGVMCGPEKTHNECFNQASDRTGPKASLGRHAGRLRGATGQLSAADQRPPGTRSGGQGGPTHHPPVVPPCEAGCKGAVYIQAVSGSMIWFGGRAPIFRSASVYWSRS